MIINPSPQEKKDYLLLRKAFSVLFSSLKVGKKISESYEEVYQIFKEEKPEEWLQKHLGENFGYSIGFKHQEKSLEITPTNNTQLEENMVIYIRLYYKDLEYRGKTGFGFIIGDTIILTKNGAKNLTKNIRKNFADISYVIKDDDDEEESEEEKDNNGNDEDFHETDGNLLTETRLRNINNGEKRGEVKRKQHQDELLNVKLAELHERLAKKDIVMSSAKQKAQNMGDIKSYRNPKEVPANIPPRKIFLDDKRDTILLPIGKKSFAPIHLLLVKNISLTSQGD